jgi:hypothetical protein
VACKTSSTLNIEVNEQKSSCSRALHTILQIFSPPSLPQIHRRPFAPLPHASQPSVPQPQRTWPEASRVATILHAVLAGLVLAGDGDRLSPAGWGYVGLLGAAPSAGEEGHGRA